jgi:hypothetical protein
MEINMDTYDANVRIKNLPRMTDTVINALATKRGMLKWELIRDALTEFAENHKQELDNVARV